MRASLICLMLICCGQSVLCQQSLPEQALQPNELRLILFQLYELKALRQQVAEYEAYIKREQEQDTRETMSWRRAIELEQQATALMQRERDLALEKAELYRQLYEATKKKSGGFGCVLKKIFTLGLGRCGG